jgi:glycosyltransferase involved in cell wall biosynthesis
VSGRSPEFSIVVPTYGRPVYLLEALASVIQQSVTDFECIVVNDASPGPVAPLRDPRIRTIERQVNGGPAAARNTGIAAARGRYLVFLDDDDLYTPDRLAMAQEGLRRAPIAICWSAYIGERARPQRRLNGIVYHEILNETAPHLGTVAVDRQLVPPFDEDYAACEDLEWWLRASRDIAVATVPRYGYHVRRHSGLRLTHGPQARITFSKRLLHDQASYFRTHRRAAAFRWKRIGLMSLSIGDPLTARSALLRSIRLLPSPSAARHLGRTLLAQRTILRQAR